MILKSTRVIFNTHKTNNNPAGYLYFVYLMIFSYLLVISLINLTTNIITNN